MSTSPKRIVLAYSGGLDTSVILHWLKAQYQAEVIAFCADVGQPEDLSGVEAKALNVGAKLCYVKDLKAEFVRDYCFPMFRAGAIYEGTYLLGTSIARPLIAKAMMDIAAAEGADAIAHGATGKGNDQVRFELAATSIDPHIKVIAPWRTWDLKSRTDCINYCKKHEIPIEVSPEKPYSMDANLLHISYEGGVLEDPWAGPVESMFQWTTAPEAAPNEAEEIVIGYEKGDPVAVNGEALAPHLLLERLNTLGARHGIGRIDIVESRFVGMKSRGVYETPGGTILHQAHRALEALTLDREVLRLKDQLVPEYATAVYRGFWFAPERHALQALVDQTQARVTGDVRLKLYKGSACVTGRRSPFSLYEEDLATFEADSLYNQADAGGFIRLQALRLQLAAKQHQLG